MAVDHGTNLRLGLVLPAAPIDELIGDPTLFQPDEDGIIWEVDE